MSTARLVRRERAALERVERQRSQLQERCAEQTKIAAAVEAIENRLKAAGLRTINELPDAERQQTGEELRRLQVRLARLPSLG
jgi:hypothetical protein